ncbi:MAG TPA: MBL fold metallo-hydrolase [bacterium]|jgi:competence protein ComEC|nr:MBL fold metallo-hydrolase [bacterium]
MKKTDLVIVVVLYILFSFRSLFFKGNEDLEITFWDVGQGDSIMISTPNKKRIIIDGGDNFEADFEISKIIPFYSCYIDVLVLTHPHYDHIKSLNRLMQRCKIGSVMFNDVDFTSRDFSLFKDLSKKMNVRNLYAGDQFEIDGVEFKILWPKKDFLQSSIADINDVSIVMFLDYGDFEAIFTGDATEKVLGLMDYNWIEDDIEGGVDVLKIPHHGSKYSLHKSFYQKANPAKCVISVGKDNKFGHPSPAVIDYLKSRECGILRTDEMGDVKIRVTKPENMY